MSSSITPSPLTWTIRLKQHKTTVLLHVQSLLKLSNLKEELLTTLNEISPSGLNGESLPSSASEIQFAKPVDPLDVTQGWEPLEPDELDDPFSSDDDAPKGKSKKLPSDNLKAFGIKDNAVLAFRFAGEKEWDVVTPTFMDEYGVENVGDMGVHREFKG